jgi:hypothetical protein
MLAMFRDDPEYESNNDRRHDQRILLLEEPEPGRAAAPNGEQPDAGRRWLVTFSTSGISTSPDDGPADAIVAGSASDLWLYIMGRRPAEEMHVKGVRELAASWGDLAGRF